MPAGVQCIYCGGPTSGVRKGDHIVPEAMGGELTLKCVCKTCNGEFSKLEQELCSRSPLSIILQQELGTESTTSWDYDIERDIALEARPLPGFRSPVLWPQLIFLGEKIHFRFDQEEAEPELVVRALVKIGVNLLTHILGPGVVNSTTFPIATRFARWGADIQPNLNRNGFVTQSTLTAIVCPERSHKFELLHSHGLWRLIAVFFGGLIGGCVYFPGPLPERDFRYEIVVPIGGKQWKIAKSRIHLPSREVRTLWDDLSTIMPSLPIRHRGSTMRVERQKRRSNGHGRSM